MTRRQKASSALAAVRIVAGYELRVRHRARGWQWLLALWFALVSGAGLATERYFRGHSDDNPDAGPEVYGAVVALTLLLLLLVVPALARPPDGRLVRGARTAPRLAGLEADEIVLGELAAAWVVVGILVVLALPAMAYAVHLGGVPLRAVLLGAAALGAMGAAVAALAQWRPALTYLLLVVLCAGTPLAYDAALPITSYPVTDYDPSTGRAVGEHREVRPHKVWWILAGSPFAVVADAARPSDRRGAAGVLSEWSDEVRARHGSPDPYWPRGLAFFGLLGAAAVGVTVTRLRTVKDKAIVR